MKQSALLKRILAQKRSEVAAAKKLAPAASLKELLAKAPPTRHFREAITRRRPYEIHLIGELKKASPSKGVIRAKLDVGPLAKEMESAGASALSVLTDAKFFQGSMENLKLAKAGCELPVLRKDFIVDEYQILESRLAGADAILLIVRLLAQDKLKHFVALAKNLGLLPIAETHVLVEVKRALDAGAEVIGVNTRDLGTFKTDFAVAAELRPKIPAGCVAVCESGVESPKQIEALRELRYDAVLVGTSIMKAKSTRAAVQELLYT